jgi:hypothetical protein
VETLVNTQGFSECTLHLRIFLGSVSNFRVLCRQYAFALFLSKSEVITIDTNRLLLMKERSQVKSFSPLVVLSSILDFAMNTIFIPSLSTDLFITVILCMVEIVTILLQFFSWFFMLTSLREFRQGGYGTLLANFWHLFATTGTYILLFLIGKVVLFVHMGNPEDDLYVFWNNGAILATWSLERIVAVVHYAFSIYYVMKIMSNPRNFT